MRQTKAKYRAIIRANGECVPGFEDEEGNPIDMGESTTYFPDDHELIEETNKARMRTKLIERKNAVELHL